MVTTVVIKAMNVSLSKESIVLSNSYPPMFVIRMKKNEILYSTCIYSQYMCINFCSSNHTIYYWIFSTLTKLFHEILYNNYTRHSVDIYIIYIDNHLLGTFAILTEEFGYDFRLHRAPVKLRYEQVVCFNNCILFN